MTRNHYKPLFRSTIGFDGLFDFLDAMANDSLPTNTYPPYNIEKFEDDRYIITMAVSGFSKSNMEVVLQENRLTITGNPDRSREEGVFLHKGIAARAFQHTFNLADFMEIERVTLDNGLLRVFLFKRIPDAQKAKRLNIEETTEQTPGSQKLLSQND